MDFCFFSMGIPWWELTINSHFFCLFALHLMTNSRGWSVLGGARSMLKTMGWRRLELHFAESRFHHKGSNLRRKEPLDVEMSFGYMYYPAMMPYGYHPGFAMYPVSTQPVPNTFHPNMPGSAGVAPAIHPVATAQVQANMPRGPDAGPAIKNPVANKSTQTNLNKKPEPPDMDLAIRHIAVTYFFQSGLQLKDICERLDIQKGSLAHMISVIKKRVPDYEAEKDIRVLLAAAPSKSLARAAPYITKSTALPDIRHAPGNHRLRRAFETSRPCTQCRHVNRRDRTHKVHRTRYCCIKCDEAHPLCPTCQRLWHSKVPQKEATPPAEASSPTTADSPPGMDTFLGSFRVEHDSP
jgi:hypothetical protein